MRSMTGFGEGTAENGRIRATVTLRAVNHRYLDLVLRLRDEMRVFERSLRELLTADLERGRVEVAIDVERLERASPEITVDQAAVAAVHSAGEALRQSGIPVADLSFADLLRLPDVVQVRAEESGWEDDDGDTIHAAAANALAQLVEARTTEGQRLHATFEPRLEEIRTLGAQLQARREAIADAMLDNLRQRLSELLAKEGLDEARLAQEAALLVDRSDVSEELDRLSSHLDHFRELMDADGALGKRLDFLTQEIFRELNTLGAKCRDSEMVRAVVDAKVLCEQIREQVQNVE